MNARGNRWVFEVLGHLKPGVTPAQANADLSSIGAYLDKGLSQRRRSTKLQPGAAGFAWKLFCSGDTGVSNGVDAAGGIDPAGRLRESGQPVCGAGGGSVARGRIAARAGVEPHADSAATVYRGRFDFARRRRSRIVGQRDASALAERVAAISAISHEYSGESGRECVCGGFAVGAGQRIAFWRGAGAAGAAHESV